MAINSKKNVFNTVLLINARSIEPKLESLRKGLYEFYADICFLMEMWLSDNARINNILEDYQRKYNWKFIRRDRKTGGGVAIGFNTEKIEVSKEKLPPSKHELCAAIGCRQGQRRKIALLVAYVLPWYNADQMRSFYRATNDALMAIKNKYSNPYVLVAGDFNRRSFTEEFREYPEIKVIPSGPTRQGAVLDIMGSNFNYLLFDQGTTTPISTVDGVDSDHMTVISQFRMPRIPSYRVEKYSYYHVEEIGFKCFGEWLEQQS